MKITLLSIVAMIGLIALMMTQTKVSKLKNPLWGGIIPALMVAAAIYCHLIVRVKVTYGTVMIFVICIGWSLEQWYLGRKRRVKDAEKEIVKMKAKDIGE